MRMSGDGCRIIKTRRKNSERSHGGANERSMSRVVFHPAVSGDIGESELVPTDPSHQALLHPTAQVVLRLDSTFGLVSLVGLETSEICLHERRAVVEVVQRERASVRRTHRESIAGKHTPSSVSFISPSGEL
jgi:hypothetical protein